MERAVISRKPMRITTAFVLALAMVAGLTVVVGGLSWLAEEYARFAQEVQSLRREFLEEQKVLVRNEVAKVLDYISYRHSKAEDVLRAGLRERVNEAHAIATRLYEVERGKRSRQDVEGLIREALRPIRFNNGRGYYFIVGMDGVEQLYPVAPELEGKNLLDLQDARSNFVIQDEIRLLLQHPEGFVFDYWRKPTGSAQMVFPKMTFVKRFEPFDWYLGTGEYLDDFERDLQDEMLERIARVRFGTEGYVFVNTYDGTALITDGTRVSTPTNLWDLADPNGVKVIQEERKACEKPGGDYIYYSWNKLSTAEPAPKVSFVTGYPEWRWMVGAGVYLDEVEGVIAERRLELGGLLRSRLLLVGGILLALGAAVVLIAAHFSRRARRSFDAFSTFFDRAAIASSPIDESELHFSEFVSLARSANAMVEARQRAEAEKRGLEEELLRSRKMEALGLLAGGVAHDLNNILSGLVMYPDLMLMELPPDSPMRRRALAIKEAGQRAAAVVADLLAVSLGTRTATRVLSMNAVVEGFLASPEWQRLAEQRPTVALRAELDPVTLNIRCSPSQLGKTLTNLIINALDAIQGSGRVTVSTSNRYLEHPHVGYETIPPGEYVVLRIEDTGSGISPDDLTRVFEPFFTKKILGRPGAGLGLMVVWHTVKDNGGYVDARSGTSGTIFELFFPVCRDGFEDLPPPIPIDELKGRGERILVVDDEPTQRDIAEDLLTRLGYDVAVAASGEEAVALVGEREFDLVVLDMIMSPGMGGRETYQAILRRRPLQKAIIASGFAETEDIRETLAMGAGRAIVKPYTIEVFASAVRSELDRRGSA